MISFPGKALDRLLAVREDLQNHKNDKNELLKISIEKRLNKSLVNYYSSLNKSLSYLQSKNINKYKDKV